MDNASKNAGDMINRFQILFNRTRQAVITGELVEIITGYVPPLCSVRLFGLMLIQAFLLALLLRRTLESFAILLPICFFRCGLGM